MLNLKVTGYRFTAAGRGSPVIPFLMGGPSGQGWEQVTGGEEIAISPSAFDWRKVEGPLADALQLEVEAFASKADQAIANGDVPVLRGFEVTEDEVDHAEVTALRAEVARLTAQLAQVRSVLA